MHLKEGVIKKKRGFWKEMDGVIGKFDKAAWIVIGADLNGHVGEEERRGG